MPTKPSSAAPATLVLGALMAAGLWGAGNEQLAFMGFVAAAILREAGRARSCRP